MPLLRFDLYKGRTEAELKSLLDAVHQAMLEAFGVPERDRYQIVHEHEPSRMIMEDTGLDIPPHLKFCVHPSDNKAAFTRAERAVLPAHGREARAGRAALSQATSMINMVTCTDEDWSFGLGRAQFLTGEF